MTFVEKKDDVDRSTLYIFDGPFQLLNADVGNLEFLGGNQQLIQNIVFLWIFPLLKFMSTQ